MEKNNNKKIMFVVASRPNFMKVAPLIKEAKRQNLKFSILYTEQHKSELMSGVFFRDLNIPAPEFNLNLSSKVKNSSKLKKGLALIYLIPKARNIIKKEKPGIVVVVGDVVSSAYMTIITKSLRIKIGHVEAGLRLKKEKTIEEISRRAIDKFSNLFFTTEKYANFNLINEGKTKEKIFFVGNVMIDSIIQNIDEIKKTRYYKKLNLKKKKYAVLTFHRHENITNKNRLFFLIKIAREISKKIKIIFPLHPATKKRLLKLNLFNKLKTIKNLKIISPLGYKNMINLILNSKFVMTDSGGLQEETTFLKIPCLTLRNETERPITVEIGTNTIVGFDIKKLRDSIDKILIGEYKNGKLPMLWDGKTAKRIIKILKNENNIN